jgi:hypothetical protein
VNGGCPFAAVAPPPLLLLLLLLLLVLLLSRVEDHSSTHHLHVHVMINKDHGGCSTWHSHVSLVKAAVHAGLLLSMHAPSSYCLKRTAHFLGGTASTATYGTAIWRTLAAALVLIIKRPLLHEHNAREEAPQGDAPP